MRKNLMPVCWSNGDTKALGMPDRAGQSETRPQELDMSQACVDEMAPHHSDACSAVSNV
jgi:hypothetical protein